MPCAWQKCRRLLGSLQALPSVLTATMVSTAVQLAARIAVSNLHKNTLKSFSET